MHYFLAILSFAARPPPPSVAASSTMVSLSEGLVARGFPGDTERVEYIVRALGQEDCTLVSDLACFDLMHLDMVMISTEEWDLLGKIVQEETLAYRSGSSARAPQRVSPPLDGAGRVVASLDCPGNAALDVRGVGPQSALKRLKSSVDLATPEKRSNWVEQARVSALLGSCPRSIASVKSGLRCYMNFARAALGLTGNELPPTVEGLVAWSALFRCVDTFSNYLSHVRLGCELVGVSCGALDHPSVRRAKRSVLKKRAFVPRRPFFIRLALVQRLLGSGRVEQRNAMMLFLTAYIFLLRLPSEALPIRIGGSGCPDGEHAVIVATTDRLQLTLRSRKNRAERTVLTRTCWCAQCELTCPVHVLGAYFAPFGSGVRPFAGFTPASALAILRTLLTELGVADAHLYRTHDLRRGHARDLQARGATLREILLAGDWRSAAFLKYLDIEQLEDDVVVEAHLDPSSDEGV